MKDACPRLAVAFSLLALATAAPLRAQEEPEPEQGEEDEELALPPPPEEAKGPRLELTVVDALRLAVSNNIELERSQITTEIARYDAMGSWGAFDWVFDAGVSSAQSRSLNPQSQVDPTSGTLFFVDVSADSTNLAGDIDFSKPLTTGGRFDINFDYRDFASDSSVTGTDLTDQTTSTTTLGLAYTQPLLRGAWASYATSTQREAEVAYNRQLEAHRQAQHNLLLVVRNAYWDLVSALEQREVARSALDLGLEQLNQNTRRREAGVGTDVEVLQAKAEVATRIEGLILAENTVQQAMDDLKKQLFPGEGEGFRDLWESVIVPVTPLPEEMSTEGLPSWENAYEVALTRRPELQQQRLDVDIARLRHERTISERRPGLDFLAGANSSGRDFSQTIIDDTGMTVIDDGTSTDLLDLDIYNYSAGLTYNMRVGNRLARNSERAARELLRSARLLLEQTETDVLAEVRKAVRDVQTQAEAVRAAQTSLRLAQEQLQAEQARFAEGLSTNFEVLSFQQALIEALSSERNARVSFMKALAALSNAQGLIANEVGVEE